jgi:hypothetical protein
MKNYKLAKEIIDLSFSNTWEEAKREWFLSHIYFSHFHENCLCGHEIVECCVLENTLNKNRCIVGNVCVNKFMGIESNTIFDSVKKVKEDFSKSLNYETISYAYDKKWINDWEKTFYLDTLRKRKPSEKQLFKRQQINQKIIYKILNPTQ